MKKLTLVDGSDLLQAALKSKVYASARMHDGKKIGGLLGFLTFLQRALDVSKSSSRCIVFWDGVRHPGRAAIDPSYRENWMAFLPEDSSQAKEYLQQQALIRSVLSYLGVESYQHSWLEVRDILSHITSYPRSVFPELPSGAVINVVGTLDYYQTLVSVAADSSYEVVSVDPVGGNFYYEGNKKTRRCGESALLVLMVMGSESFGLPGLGKLCSLPETLDDFYASIHERPLDLVSVALKNHVLLKPLDLSPHDSFLEDMEDLADSEPPDANLEVITEIFQKYELYKFTKDLDDFMAPFVQLRGSRDGE